MTTSTQNNTSRMRRLALDLPARPDAVNNGPGRYHRPGPRVRLAAQVDRHR